MVPLVVCLHNLYHCKIIGRQIYEKGNHSYHKELNKKAKRRL
jgi:hypothetical protein